MKVNLGVTGDEPRFCTTTVETPVPTPETPFTAYGPYTLAAPLVSPFIEYRL